MTDGKPGPHLRRERERAGVQLIELAAELGVDRGTVWRYEGSAYVKAEKARRYEAALAAIVSRRT